MPEPRTRRGSIFGRLCFESLPFPPACLQNQDSGISSGVTQPPSGPGKHRAVAGRVPVASPSPAHGELRAVTWSSYRSLLYFPYSTIPPNTSRRVPSHTKPYAAHPGGMSPLTAGMNHWLVAGEQKEAEVRIPRGLLRPRALTPLTPQIQQAAKHGLRKEEPRQCLLQGCGTFLFEYPAPALYPSHLLSPLPQKPPYNSLQPPVFSSRSSFFKKTFY